MSEKETKTCFVICPIGDEGTDIRKRSDEVLNEIIKPAVQKCGYEPPIRGDHITRPGIITMQLLDRIYEADLVIADLTDHNPNVFYELAFRHAVKRPVITIIEADQELPFDLEQVRAIKFRRDLTGGRKCEEDIVKQITSIEENPDEIDSPISLAFDYKQLRDSENLLDKGLTMIMDRLDDIRSKLPPIPRAVIGVEPASRYPVYGRARETSPGVVEITPAGAGAINPYYPYHQFPWYMTFYSEEDIARLRAALGPKKFDEIVASPLKLAKKQLDFLLLAMGEDIRFVPKSTNEKPDDNSK